MEFVRYSTDLLVPSWISPGAWRSVMDPFGKTRVQQCHDTRTVGMDKRIMMMASFTSQMVDAHSLECSMMDIMPGEVAIERNEEIPSDRLPCSRK